MRTKKILSLVLAAALMISAVPTTAFAENGGAQDSGVTIGASGLCEHHTEHTEDCSYTEGTPETPCTHEHAPECYPEADSVSGNEATPTDPAEPTSCTHTGHTDDCGYAPAVEGTPCGYVCEICNPQDNGQALADQPDPIAAVQALIDALPDADKITEANAEEVREQLTAIDEAKGALAETMPDEVDALDYTRYTAAIAALDTLAGQAGASTPMLAAVTGNYLVLSWDEDTKKVTSTSTAIPTNATEITNDYFSNSSTTLSAGTYCVTGENVTASGRITISGEVHLILMDGCKLEAQKGITVSPDNKLSIYAQSKGEQMGQLNATMSSNETGAAIGGGLEQSCGDITIHGGVVNAKSSDSFSAGIGDGNNKKGTSGTITIYDGRVTAESSARAAGIGGSEDSGGGDVHIYGGYVTAKGGSYASSDIGAGVNNNGDVGSFTLKGNAVVMISLGISDDDNSEEWNGIVFKGNEGTVYGNVTLTSDFTISSGQSLTIPAGSSLTMADGATLTNNGTIQGEGEINGTVNGNTPDLPVAPTITTQPSNQSVAYGQTATFSVTASGKPEPTYQWWVSKDNGSTWEDISGATGTSYIISNPAVSMNGWKYHCVVTNSKSEVTSNEATLTVTAAQLAAPNILEWDEESTWARWSEVTGASSYSVQLYKGSDTTALETKDVTSTYCAFIHLANPAAGSYTFKVKAVSNSANYTDSPESAASDALTYYAVTFNTNGGGSIDQQIIISGGKVTKPADPTKADHDFKGWFSNPELSTEWNFDNEISGTTTLYAKWEAHTYTITASPESYDFGSLKVDYTTAPTAQTVTIANTGNQDVTVNLPTSTHYDITAGTNFTNGTATLDPNATATFTVQPKTGLAKGTYNTAINISGTDGASVDFTPTFTVTAADLTLTAPTFSSLQAGYGEQTAQAITITNSGDAEAAIEKVEVSGTEFIVEGSGNAVPANNGSIDTWKIKPNTGLAGGTHSGTITVTYDGGKTVTANVSLIVTAPVLEVTAPTFAGVQEGYSQPAAQGITIKNTGDAAANISSVAVDNSNFSISGSGSTVAAGSSISSWTVQPTTGLAKGTYTGTITVSYDNNATATAQVSFTVTAPVLEVTAPIFDGVQEGYSQPAAQGITIKNTGDADATIISVVVDNTAAFTIGGSGGSVTASNSITSWTVQPSGSLSKGTYIGTITVNYDNGEKATAQVSFGVAAPNLVITPPTFAGVQEGYTQPAAQNITIQNTGDAAANISSVTVDNSDFTIDGSGSTVAAGGSISSWTVQPSEGLAVGEHTATITVEYDNGAEATATVSFAVSEKTYSVAASVSPANSGSVSGGGTYNKDADVILTATAATGYHFLKWTENGADVAGAGATYTFTATADRTLVAVFEADAPTPHTHTFESGWTSDSTGHWHKATCGHTEQKGSFAAHTPGAAATAATPQTCTVCDYVITPATGGGYDDGGDDDYTPPTPKPQPETGESGGWNEIRSELRGAQSGDTIVVQMNGATVVPKEVLREIAQREITVIFEMSGGVSWTVNGKGIPQTIGDLNVGIKTDSNSIPVTVINALTGEVSTMQFELSHSGPFGTILHLTLDVGRENRGYWANLYYFDEAQKELVFQYASRIDASGRASWPFDHASSYAVVIDEENHDTDGDKTNPNTGGNDNPDTGAGNPFTDVKETDWFYEDVLFVYYEGIMLGTSDTTFSPNGTLTRGMMAAILWRMEGSPAPSGKNPFTDVPADEYYTDAATWTKEQGIFEGYGNNLFGPNDPITRQQLAAIFYRYAAFKGYDLTPTDSLDRFTDTAEIADWAQDAVKWAVGSGLMYGTTDTTFAPKATATRAQIAAMLHRFITKYELEERETYTGLMGWVDPNSDYLNFPKTGDSSHTGFWAGMTLFAAAGTAATLVYRRKRRKDDGATPTPA